MRRIKARQIPKWMQRHPILARLYAAGFILGLPVVFPCVAVWELRTDLIEAADQAWRTLLLPWDKDDG